MAQNDTQNEDNDLLNAGWWKTATPERVNQAMADVRKQGSAPVPLHLRNAPTKLAADLGHGKHYRYAHNEPDAYAAGEHYFPDDYVPPPQYYQPVSRGLEIKIAEKMARLRRLDGKT